ncbi:MAG: hypothetical protein PVF26_02180 [Desulfobacterales bacterium]|jgi:hypothetical protein
MTICSAIGIILLIAAFILFGYQGLSAFLKMGATDEFVYENIRLVDILDEKYYSWIYSISWVFIQGIAETFISTPLALWLLCGAVFFLLIHAFTSETK